MAGEMGGPLKGIRVVECTQWLYGSVVGLMLGELGADVIKVESKEGGDPARGLLRISQMKKTPGDQIRRNFFVEYANRNKRSIALDLRQEKGKEIIYQLIREADVFVHNFRLDVPPRLGLDYETLRRHNPKLIYAQCSGFGPEGPDCEKPAFEPIAWARMGWLYFAGETGMPPSWFVSGPGDEIGASKMVVAVLAALFARETQGVGQLVDASLLGSLISIAGIGVNTKLVLGEEFPRRGRAKVVNPLANFYQCGDGKWIFLFMLQSDRYWHDFCNVVGIEELDKDPRFGSFDARQGNAEELTTILDRVFATKPREEWLRLLEAQKDFIFAPIQTISEMVEDPQVLANDYIAEFDHPSYGLIKVVGVPYKFSKMPVGMRSIAPELGQHTEEILLELGYTWEDIAELREQTVIL